MHLAEHQIRAVGRAAGKLILCSRRLVFRPGRELFLCLFYLFPVRARLVQTLAIVVVNVNPEVELSIAFSQVSCFLERFTVFQERAARPCEGVDWILSYYSILTLRCAYLHYSPQRLGFSLNTPTLSRKQPKGSGEVTHSKSQKIFSHFFRSRCSLVSEGSFDPVGGNNREFHGTGASFELGIPLRAGGLSIATRMLLHVDHLRPVSQNLRNAENPSV
jgi:hypothetical protein